VRLDQYVAGQMGCSRARAQSLIRAGCVRVDGITKTRPSVAVPPHSAIEIAEDPNPYVSRGGVKLAHALAHFAINPRGLIALDVGASTGGFTDVLLSRGAAKVYAVDVGHGQLNERLRSDPRVVDLERTDARDLSADLIPELVHMIAVDVSFISLRLVLPPVLECAAPGAKLVALIKPQFEAGRGQIGKGVVRDPAVRQAAVDGIADWLRALPRWHVDGVIESPITGGDGNEEHLIAAHETSGAVALSTPQR